MTWRACLRSTALGVLVANALDSLAALCLLCNASCRREHIDANTDSLNQDLPRPGAQVFLDSQAIASWTYDNASHTMISYDTPEVVAQKVRYIQTRNLGGAMWWETSGDQPSSSNRSLINAAAIAFNENGSNSMENSENCLDYSIRKAGMTI